MLWRLRAPGVRARHICRDRRTDPAITALILSLAVSAGLPVVFPEVRPAGRTGETRPSAAMPPGSACRCGPTAAEPTAAEPTAAEPTAAEPTAAEPSAAEPSAASRARRAERRLL
jgi:hypothetical protein